MSKKIVHISDTHEYEPQHLPEGDILIHSGDFSFRASEYDVRKFNRWLGTLDYEKIIVVPGNHDIILEGDPDTCREILTNCTLLIDEEVVVDGIRIYGTPWSLTYGNWAFMGNEIKLELKYQKIPPGIDILVSHGPAYGILDYVPEFNHRIGEQVLRHTGSHALNRAIREVKPKYVLSGHIHEAHGRVVEGDVTYLNSAIKEGKDDDFTAQSTYCAPVAANRLVFKHKEKDSYYLRVYPNLCFSFKSVVRYFDAEGVEILSEAFKAIEKEYFALKGSNDAQGLDDAVIVNNYKLENVKFLKRGDIHIDELTAAIVNITKGA